jgi:glycosyltransferase involved in cell wall biosynthesis
MKLIYLASHPIQYHAPLFRALAGRCAFEAWFAHRQDAQGQAAAGYATPFEWDVDVLSGFAGRFLHNVAREPSVQRFGGCDVPDIAGLLAQARPDALVVGGWNLKVYWQARRAARGLGIPVFARSDSQRMPGDGLVRRIGRQLVHRVMLRGFDGFLVAGTRSTDYLRGLGIPPARIAVVPHTIDVARFAAARARRDGVRAALDAGTRRVLLFVGRLVPMKRAGRLVAAMQGRDPGREVLWIVGDGPLRAALEAQAASTGAPVRFLGFRNQSELPELMAAADLLVLPSQRDTWGLVVNEALAAGTPALVDRSAGCAPDLGRFAPAVRVCDDDLAAALGTPESAGAALEHARQQAVASFAPDAAASALLAALERRRAA